MRRHPWKASIGVVVGLLAAIAPVLLSAHGQRASRSEARPILQVSAGALPDRCGQTTTLDEAVALDPQIAIVPDSSLANVDNLAWIVWCPYPTLVEGFASGVWVVIRPNELQDPASDFAQMAADNPGVDEAKINGNPAVEADPAQDPTGQLAGGVEFVIGGDYVGVYGDGKIALADLIAVAESIPPPPAGPSPTPSDTPTPTPS